MNVLHAIEAPERSRERIAQLNAVLSANIKRCAKELLAWAERPGDEWLAIRATDAARRVWPDADGLHELMYDQMHDLGMDPEGYPLTDEGDPNWKADRAYAPMADAKVEGVSVPKIGGVQ